MCADKYLMDIPSWSAFSLPQTHTQTLHCFSVGEKTKSNFQTHILNIREAELTSAVCLSLTNRF
jgi:hypothetical protein